MLRCAARRARRAAGSVLSLSPKSRSKTARGLCSIGSGVDPLAQAIVYENAQLKPPLSHEPAKLAPSRPSSSEATGVWRPSSRAAIWSMETACGFQAPGCSAVRNLVEAREWLPPLMPGGGVLLSPDSTSRRSRNDASGWSVGVNSNPAPSAAGVQFCMTIPFGT